MKPHSRYRDSRVPVNSRCQVFFTVSHCVLTIHHGQMQLLSGIIYFPLLWADGKRTFGVGVLLIGLGDFPVCRILRLYLLVLWTMLRLFDGRVCALTESCYWSFEVLESSPPSFAEHVRRCQTSFQIYFLVLWRSCSICRRRSRKQNDTNR